MDFLKNDNNDVDDVIVEMKPEPVVVPE